jgi:hypothetical protein
MDPRINLLKAFYRGLPTDRVKVETLRHGFPFLDELLAGGAKLEYGELTLAGTLHKYKLAGVPAHRVDDLLQAHVAKECNVCLYFDAQANSLFCFNLDNNYKENNTVVIPEMDLAVRTLREQLTELGCEPLVIASGRGFHLWCRLDAPVENAQLHGFMIRCAARVAAVLHENGCDHLRIKFNFYPDSRTDNTVSLRLFGSNHAKNRAFSHIFTPSGLLDEAASWAWFENHLRTRTVPAETFARARETVLRLIPARPPMS